MVRRRPPASGDGAAEGAQKLRRKASRRGFRIGGPDNAVVIARDRDDRRGIVAVWFVELIVVIRGFAEVVDDVAEMIEERRHVGGVGFSEVRDHFVGDEVLGVGTFRAAGIADAMEDDLAGGGDGLGFGRSLAAVDLLEGEDGFDGLARRLRNRLDGGDLGIVLIGDGIPEAGWVRRWLGLREDGIACGRRMDGFPWLFFGLRFRRGRFGHRPLLKRA